MRYVRYIGLVLLVMICSGFSCQAHKGHVKATRAADGSVIYSWDSKTAFDAGIKTVEGDTINIKTMEAKKPSFVEKAVGKAASMAEQAIILEKSKDIRNPIQ